jgi:hypothetical protein
MRPIRSILAVALFASASTLAAEPSVAPPSQSEPTAVAGWNDMMNGLRDLPTQMLARLPEAQRKDPQIRQEIGRLALAAIASSALQAIGDDGDHPIFLPSPSQVLSIGQPNADTTYRVAALTAGGSYRLRGSRGSLRMARIAEAGPRATKQETGKVNLGAPRPVHDINALHVDAHGRFDVILSPTRPAGYKGDWWQSLPDSNMLFMRFISSDWGKEVDPAVSIERLDRPVARPRPSAAELEQRLHIMLEKTQFIAPLFVGQAANLRQQGYLNRLKASDFSHQGGLAGQFYYEGAYEVRDDEALILEVKPPAHCLYSSIILTNDIYETTDWVNNHSSLSDSQYRVDKDDVLRFVVSSRDPGVPNWLDTAGYPTGVIQGRWTECNSQPVPSVRKVAFADVRKALPTDTPTVTPAQREQRLRNRRAAYLQRPLW